MEVEILEVNEKKPKKKIRIRNKNIIILTSITLMILIIFIPIIIFGSKISKDTLEKEMETMVSEFYDNNIKGKVIGMNRQIVTVEDLKNQGFDISLFEKAKCKLESFSYVILEDPKEEDISKIKYTVEHHLDCKKMK